MSDVAFIAGSGRSGTTWVLDVLARSNALRPVFEPLNPWASEIGARFAHRALSATDSEPALEAYLRRAFDGRTARLWTQYRRQARWLAPIRRNLESPARLARYVRVWGRFAVEAPGLTRLALRRDPLVKCIWANLMLEWLAQRLQCRIVLVVRHPGAVIESELRSGWDATEVLERFRGDARLEALTGGRYARLLARRGPQVEALTLRWLIENQQAMERVPDGRIAVVYYEDLLDPGRRGWEAVCAHLGLEHLPDERLLSKPSQQSWERAVSTRPSHATASWLERLPEGHAARIQDVLDEAGFRAYSMRSAIPEPAAPADLPLQAKVAP